MYYPELGQVMDEPFRVGGALARLRAALPAMTPAERTAAEWLLAHPGQASRLAAAAVAQAAGVGFGSVMRACQRAGYGEYGALRTALAVELLAPPALDGGLGRAPEAGDPPALIMRSVFAAAARALDDTAQTLEGAAFAAAVDALARAEHVAIFGAGSVSGALAQLMQVRLLGAGLAACSYPHANDHAPAARRLGLRDAAVGLSQSGDTGSVVAALEAARAAGAASIGVTASARSAVARAATTALVTALASPLRGEPATSRVPMLALIDALAVAVLLRPGADGKARTREGEAE